MEKLLRFLHHARQCLVEVKEGHSNLVDWFPFLACLTVVIAPWLTPLFKPESKDWHSLLGIVARNAWHLSAGGLLLIGCLMFWRSFCRFDDGSNELTKLKGDKVTLAVTFHGPTPNELLDPIVEAATCRIGVRNRHATKTAKNVRIHLRQIECDAWPNGQKPPRLNPITAPHDFVLPLANDERAGIAYDIYPETERAFDLLFVDYGVIDAGSVLIGMAPFVAPQKPMVNYSLSFHGFFTLFRLDAPTGKTLRISIIVTCDDCQTLEHSVELRVPSIDEGPLPHFVKPT